ncbi:hypothetical protein [Brenneria nigrifluens]|uniref:hypothetical protein n=1 Tax=Brenneria nigrifluens TaxID=55210 RepID=UPI001445F604|nr:hypothetical protein [Brenneria nigrifluens]
MTAVADLCYQLGPPVINRAEMFPGLTVKIPLLLEYHKGVYLPGDKIKRQKTEHKRLYGDRLCYMRHQAGGGIKKQDSGLLAMFFHLMVVAVF